MPRTVSRRLIEELARMLRKSQKPVLLTINKIDHDKHESLAADFDSLGFDKNVSISAEHNRGIGELLDQIDQLLPAIDQQSEVRDRQVSGQRPNVDRDRRYRPA